MHIRRLFNTGPLLRIIASNMRDGERPAHSGKPLHPNRLLDDVANDVRVGIDRRITDRNPTEEDYIVELEVVCLGEMPERAGSKHLLQAVAGPLDDTPEWYTSVIKVNRLLGLINDRTLADLRERAAISLPFKPMGGSADPSLVEILKTLSTGSFTVDDKFMLGHPLAWLTQQPVFNEMVRGAPNRADRARDVLGLVHIEPGTHLVALHIPAKAVAAVASNRPTFADAGGYNRRFLLLAVPPSYPPSWGQTIDLEELETSPPLLAPGGPERVCARIRSTDLDGLMLNFDYLGEVTTARGLGVAGEQEDEIFSELQVSRDRIGFRHIVARL